MPPFADETWMKAGDDGAFADPLPLASSPLACSGGSGLCLFSVEVWNFAFSSLSFRCLQAFWSFNICLMCPDHNKNTRVTVLAVIVPQL